jgi:hypothetical protein
MPTPADNHTNLKTKEALLMQSVWRKALREGEVILQLPSESDAKRVRFTLYNSVRAVRQGKVVDEELLRATQECSIQITGSTVVIQSKMRSDMMQAVLAALGESEETLLAKAPTPKTAEEVEVEASRQRLLEKLGQVSPGTEADNENTPAGARVTPYYTR